MIDWLKHDDAEVREETEEVLHEGVSKDEPVHVTWTACFAGRREKKDRVFYLNALDASRVREGDYGPIRPLMAEAEGGPVKSRMHVKVS